MRGDLSKIAEPEGTMRISRLLGINKLIYHPPCNNSSKIIDHKNDVS